MNFLTLNEAKKHLNIESYFTDDDTYIEQLIEISFYSLKNRCNNTTWVDGTGTTNKDFADLGVDGTEIPFVIKQATLLMVGNLYNNREPVSFANAVAIPYTLEFLIAPYLNYEGYITTTTTIV